MQLKFWSLLYVVCSLSAGLVTAQGADAVSLLDAPDKGFPAELVETHNSVEKQMLKFKNDKNQVELLKVMKYYGRTLVEMERKYKKAGKEEAVEAIKKVKQQLAALFNEAKSQGGEKETDQKVTPSVQTYHVVRAGKAHSDISLNRKAWKRRQKVIVSQKHHSGLYLPNKTLCAGDFKISLRLSLSVIGSKHPLMNIGETQIGVDGPDSQAWARYGAFEKEKHQDGDKLAKLVEEGEKFNWDIERKGDILTISVNGREMLRRKIHTGDLGEISFHGGETEVEIESFSVTGVLEPSKVKRSVIVKYGKPAPYFGMVQLVKGFKGHLASFHVGYTWGRKAPKLYISVAKDATSGWERRGVVAEGGKKGELHTYAVAASTKKNDMWVVYTLGNSNQKVYARSISNLGKTISKEVEITDFIKKRGDDVRFEHAGVLLEKSKKYKGTVLLPYKTSGKEAKLYLLTTRDGKAWKKLETPLVHAKREVHILELSDGSVMITGSGEDDELVYSISKDAGESWSEKKTMKVPRQKKFIGELSLADTTKNDVLAYCAHEPLTEGIPHNSLTIWTSKDFGKTWQSQGRVTYCATHYPSLIPLSERQLGVAAFYNPHNKAEQIKFHVLDLGK